MVRTEFHQQLNSLNADLARMCELAGEAIQRATLGLLTVDLDAAERVLSDLEVLARLRREVDHAALAVLARQAPVASDLRAVVAAVHISSDADRMGGLAAHVRIVRRRHPSPSSPTRLSASSRRWAASPSTWPKTPPPSSSTGIRCGPAEYATTTKR